MTLSAYGTLYAHFVKTKINNGPMSKADERPHQIRRQRAPKSSVPNNLANYSNDQKNCLC